MARCRLIKNLTGLSRNVPESYDKVRPITGTFEASYPKKYCSTRDKTEKLNFLLECKQKHVIESLNEGHHHL